jgi:hypothetical protein
MAVIAISSQAQEDLRTVNGKTVDLAPLQKWYREKEGERPLKHWKRFQILSVDKSVGVYLQCMAKAEDGTLSMVLLANLPATTKTHFAEMEALGRKLEAADSVVNRNTAIVERQSAIADTASGDTYLAAARQVRLNELTVKEQQKQTEQIAEKFLLLKGVDIYELAMKSGHRYANQDVWDCGKR